MSVRRLALTALCIGLGVALVTPALAGAEVPRRINYQGRLTDSQTGQALPGSHTMTFRIFSQELGGTALWTESQSVDADSDGVVAAILGTDTPVDVSFTGSMWLEVEVDGEVLAPRREIVSVPYSFYAADAGHASDADSLAGLSAESYIYEGEINVITGDMVVDGSGSGLDADMIDGLDADAFADSAHDHDDRYHTESELSDPGTINDAGNPVDWTKLKGVPAGFADGTDDVSGAGDGHSLDAADGNPVDVVYVDSSGDVGIGTTNATANLHIYEDTNAAVSLTLENPNPGVSSAERISFANEDGTVAGIVLYDEGHPTYPAAMTIFNNRPSGNIRLGTGGLHRMILNNSGYVGIGTLSPTYMLDVTGTVRAEGSNSFTIGTFKNTHSGGTGVIGAGGNQVPFSATGAGVGANGYKYGLFARANQTGNNGQAAIYTQLEDGLSDLHVMINYRSESGTHYKINGDGAAATVLGTSQGRKTLICPESPEAWIEDYGSGEIVSGSCHVELDPLFLDCVTVSERHPLKVLVTLSSLLENQFYVDKGLTGFDVIVAGDGSESANATFDYKVVAKWKGHEHIRFEAYEEPEPAIAVVGPEHEGQQQQ